MRARSACAPFPFASLAEELGSGPKQRHIVRAGGNCLLEQGERAGSGAAGPRLAALLGKDAGRGGDDLWVAEAGGHRGGERFLGRRVAAPQPEDAGADKQAIRPLRSRLAVDQGVRLATKHFPHDQGLGGRDGHGQNGVEGAAVGLLDVPVGVGQGQLCLVPAAEMMQNDRPRRGQIQRGGILGTRLVEQLQAAPVVPGARASHRGKEEVRVVLGVARRSFSAISASRCKSRAGNASAPAMQTW